MGPARRVLGRRDRRRLRHRHERVAASYLRLATDQVRFYPIDAAAELRPRRRRRLRHARRDGPGEANVNEPLPLDQIPPLVFSEIMRDVDLFVGVASVGNDPTWQDGGPRGRYRDYWHSYRFGELSGTATTRRRCSNGSCRGCKIADRCSFSDRFLVVRGDLRTYKIHLGSGNILMEPNDQYLCIVPDARARVEAGRAVSCRSRGTARCRSSSARRCCWPTTQRSRTRRSPGRCEP